MSIKNKSHDHVQKHSNGPRSRLMFHSVSEAVARLVRFGATTTENGNVYIEKRVGLKVLGAFDYINTVAKNAGHGPYAVFGKAPSKAAA